MAGIALAVTAQVIAVVLMVALMVAVTVMQGILMTAPVMVTAVQSPGLVMVLLTVKTRLMAATSPVTTTTAETAEKAERRVAVMMVGVVAIRVTLMTALVMEIVAQNPGLEMVVTVMVKISQMVVT